MWWIIPVAIAAIFVVVIAVVLVRALKFVAPKQPLIKESDIAIDKAKIVADFAELIKCKTISYTDETLEDNAEFDKFYAKLAQCYPNVYAKCSLQKFPDRGLLFKWKGKNSGGATVLMSHFDVVPVDEKGWQRPAFEAIIENDIMWGRGTLDTKGTLCGILESAEMLIKQGFEPNRDIYFSFAGDEEIRGNTTPNIVKYFKDNKIAIDLLLDEGGAVVNNIFPGVKRPIAVIGTAEKGIMDVHYEMKSQGGHASNPPKHTIVGELAQAITKLEKHKFPMSISGANADMFDTLGRESSFAVRLVFANLWLFKPILDIITNKIGGELNAIVRTTQAFTVMEGSAVSNVLPPVANVVANYRLISTDNVDDTVKAIKEVVNNDKINIYAADYTNPSITSDLNCEGYKALKLAINSTWRDAIVSPYLMMACSDSRHFAKISDKVYRFSTMALSKEERGYIHGNNERIPLETLYTTVKFYTRLISAR